MLMVRWFWHLTQCKSKCVILIALCVCYCHRANLFAHIITHSCSVSIGFHSTHSSSMFLCLRQFSYFVINRITMQQPNIDFNLRAHRSICVCVYLTVCEYACVYASLRQQQIGRLCAMKRWIDSKRKEENKNERCARTCICKMVKERKEENKAESAREKTKKKCVLHAKNQFLFSLSRWLKHIFFILYQFFLCLHLIFTHAIYLWICRLLWRFNSMNCKS